MADPILPDYYRALAIYHGVSGLPEDVYVNSFVFRDDIDMGAPQAAQTCANQLDKFYRQVNGGAGKSIQQWLSSKVVVPVWTVKVYALGQAPPRTPYEFSYTAVGLSAATPLPSEVALCLSYYAGRNLPRQRGRIYIGPFTTDALALTAGVPSKPQVGLRTTLAESGNWLADEGFGGVNWHVLSQRDLMAREITGGWVDDAWDTIRKRGEDAQVRTLWGAPSA